MASSQSSKDKSSGGESSDHDDTQAKAKAALMQWTELCSCQIEEGVAEAMAAVVELSQNLLTASDGAARLEATRKMGDNDVSCEQMLVEVPIMADAMTTATAQLQFADRISQRLLNVSSNFRRLQRLAEQSDGPISGENWLLFLDEVRASYSMQAETKIFDRVVGRRHGDSAEDDSEADTNSPELF